MNSRLTRTLASVTFALAVLCGLAFVGTGVTHTLDDGAVCVQTDFWRNASLGPDSLPVGKGVKASSSAARLCQDSPSAGQRATDLGGELPWLLFSSLALLLFSRLLKAVQRLGPVHRHGGTTALHPRLVRHHRHAAGRSRRRLVSVLGSSGAWRRSRVPGRRSPDRWRSFSPASPQ
ncbi:hypothetical protein KAURM247S_01997 [Kitasatospora aureofaciens]